MFPIFRQLVAFCCLGLLAFDPWVTMFAHTHLAKTGGVEAEGCKAAVHRCSHSHGNCGFHSHHKVVKETSHTCEGSGNKTSGKDSGDHSDHCAACRHQAYSVACLGWGLSWQSVIAVQPIIVGEAIAACPRISFSHSSRGPPAVVLSLS